MSDTRSLVGFVGIAAGALAFALSLVLALPNLSQRSIEAQTSLQLQLQLEQASAAIKKAITSAEPVGLSQDPSDRQGNTHAPSAARPALALDHVGEIATGILGGVAVLLGVLGLAKKEPMRRAAGAVMLGGGAIALQFAAMAIGAIVLTIVAGAALLRLGIE